MNDLILNFHRDPTYYTLYAGQRRIINYDASVYSAALTLADVVKTLQNGRDSELERISAFDQDTSEIAGNDVLAIYTQWQGHEIILRVRDSDGELTSVCRVDGGKDIQGAVTVARDTEFNCQFKFVL